jgi:hypothetical protein
MSEFGPALTDDQRSSIPQTVYKEACRRAVESILPRYGSLPCDATTMPTDELLLRTMEGFVPQVRDGMANPLITP